jgi:RimJ/RimL family protein N-acetyltransferase
MNSGKAPAAEPERRSLRIETERLLIRNYEEQDLQDFYEIFSNPSVMRYCEPVYDREVSANWLRFYIDNPVAYAVTETRSGKMIGHALFKQMPHEEEGIYEIGWIYNELFWHQGYAYEASKALINYGFEELCVHKIVAETIDPDKSVRLMKKLGMKEDGVFRQHTLDNSGEWVDLYWYGILSRDLLRAL